MEEEKKISPIRVVLFIVMVGLAFYFIVSGVYKLTNQEPGYYALEAAMDKEASTYAHGITCTYLFDGSSNSIKAEKRAAEECYSGALLRLYKLTDSDNEYEGYTNIATINKSIGTDVKVSDELYEILDDAYRKTELGQDYSAFAGAYYHHWNNILMLSDAEPFDPVFNSEEADRLEELRTRVLNHDNFKLIFKGDNTLRLEVSEDYLKYIEDIEESTAILDLNVLREAYMVKYVKKSLADKGFTKGRITTDLGLYADLGDYGAGGYTPAKVVGGKLIFSDTIAVGKDECMSGIIAIPVEEEADRYYSVTKDSKTYYRNPFVTLHEGGFPGYIGSSYVKGAAGSDIVNVMYTNVILNSITEADSEGNPAVPDTPFEEFVYELK